MEFPELDGLWPSLFTPCILLDYLVSLRKLCASATLREKRLVWENIVTLQVIRGWKPWRIMASHSTMRLWNCVLSVAATFTFVFSIVLRLQI